MIDSLIGLDMSGVQHCPCRVRGVLEFSGLPESLASAERDQLELDEDVREEFGSANRTRAASDAERYLLRHLGYRLPQRLTTTVQWRGDTRRRTWPQLENDRRVP